VLARLPIATPAAANVNLHLNQYTTKQRRTYDRIVFWQHTSLKIKRLLSHHKSILVQPKSGVRVGEIAH
jgi:hypothetical protein